VPSAIRVIRPHSSYMHPLRHKKGQGYPRCASEIVQTSVIASFHIHFPFRRLEVKAALNLVLMMKRTSDDLKQTRGRNHLNGALTVAPRVGSLSIVRSPQPNEPDFRGLVWRTSNPSRCVQHSPTLTDPGIPDHALVRTDRTTTTVAGLIDRFSSRDPCFPSQGMLGRPLVWPATQAKCAGCHDPSGAIDATAICKRPTTV